jgi:DNA-binding beta-propeller fold protein YncE
MTQHSTDKMPNIFRFLVRALALPAILWTAALGQIGGTTSQPTGQPIKFVGLLQSDSDVDVARTPCQRIRDRFDHTGEAHDVAGEREALCDQVLNVIAGKAEPMPADSKLPITPARVVTDSQRRIIFTEPATRSIHILDFEKKKYIRINGAKDDRVLFPFGVAVDAEDKVYVTDGQRGMIDVFKANGKFNKYIGNYKGEGAFQSPNSIAIDLSSGRIYLTDTTRHLVLILDHKGKEIARIGKRGGGTGPGEFLLPTHLTLHGRELFVLDKQNKRIQVFNLEGRFLRELRPEDSGPFTGMAVDPRGLIYLMTDMGNIEVISPKNGELLLRFGNYGTQPGEFVNPNGIFIDSSGRLSVADTGNRRVQVFQITDVAKTTWATTTP